MNKVEKIIFDNALFVEQELKRQFSIQEESQLIQSMLYSLMSGGKRIRPCIVMESYKAFSNDNNISKSLLFACALEFIHTYSLIHDDLPCMDDDKLRRGKPTNHIVFGEATALLAGDSLLTQAFEIASSNDCVTDKSIKLAVKALAQCSGALGMAGGQMLDLTAKTSIKSFDDLKKMYALKTGALIKCASLLGYYSYTDNPSKEIEDSLGLFGLKVGVAFQIRDDILDIVSSNEKLGKTIGSDLKNDKITALSFLSLSEAQEEVEQLTNSAIKNIRECLGEKADILVEIAKYLIEREK